MAPEAGDHIQHHRAHIADAPRRVAAANEICRLLRSVGINPRSVLDVGCGYGYFLAAAQRMWKPERLKGIDGPWVERQHIHIAQEDFEQRDLLADMTLEESFDLAASLEVAEHLAPERGPALIEMLTRAAPIVLFSAAIPGQGGQGHVNERFLDYWGGLFAAHDYVPVDILHDKVWKNQRLFLWFRQNLILFVSRNAMADYTHFESFVIKPEMLARVHPDMFRRKIAVVRKLRRELVEAKSNRAMED